MISEKMDASSEVKEGDEGEFVKPKRTLKRKMDADVSKLEIGFVCESQLFVPFKSRLNGVTWPGP